MWRGWCSYLYRSDWEDKNMHCGWPHTRVGRGAPRGGSSACEEATQSETSGVVTGHRLLVFQRSAHESGRALPPHARVRVDRMRGALQKGARSGAAVGFARESSRGGGVGVCRSSRVDGAAAAVPAVPVPPPSRSRAHLSSCFRLFARLVSRFGRPVYLCETIFAGSIRSAMVTR
jgi:hypothetical protein